jgi:putative SOS response-associated peptidase YedK
MCYHFSQTKSTTQLEKAFKVKKKPGVNIEATPHINGFDLPSCAIITNEMPDLLQGYSWGLLPPQFTDEKIRRMTLNAKIETLSDKLSFKTIVQQRCLIPATSFFEWQWLNHKGSEKQKFQIFSQDHEVFAFAGLWHRLQWQNQTFETFTILTTQANKLMAEIHNQKQRMPVVVLPQDYHAFLNNESINNFAYPYQVALMAEKVRNEGDLFSLFE